MLVRTCTGIPRRRAVTVASPIGFPEGSVTSPAMDKTGGGVGPGPGRGIGVGVPGAVRGGRAPGNGSARTATPLTAKLFGVGAAGEMAGGSPQEDAIKARETTLALRLIIVNALHMRPPFHLAL